MTTIDVHRTYLELTAPEALRPKRLDDPRLALERVRPCPVSLYRQLYRDVGAEYHWEDRNAWSDAALGDYLARPSVHVWVLRYDGEVAGYFELLEHREGAEAGSVEIAYFGLVGRFIGRGLGAHMLTRAVEEAWRLGARRVWLHTCTLDSPHALPNYEARGFTAYRRETYKKELERSQE